jgi:long-chain acyl-CoA synthetase
MTDAVPGTVEHWAALKPDAIAIVEGDRTLSFAAWNHAADRVAAGLQARGVERGDIVVLRTQIRLEWAVLSAALGKLGCSLLALNWRLTAPETQYVLANSGATVFICDDPDPTAMAPALADLPIKLAVSIDTPANGFVSYTDLAATSAEPQFSAGDPPLIIYTSGTTGLPKGVVMNTRQAAKTDRRAAEYLQDVASRRPQVAGDVVLLTLPMHHGAGPSALWGTLRLGNRIILMRRFDPAGALGLIARHKVTVWTGVPTMYKRIAGLPPEELARHDVSSLRLLGVGAAPVPPALKDWIDGYFGPGRLSEGYGATEVGMITHLAPDMHRLKPGSSGLPHKHVDIRIRDEDGNDLPAGAVGEIWVRTPATIRQYLNGKPLGADTLDADGFFRVGDVGRLDADGYLFITDRAKDMIISGGVNIYPAEIEAALLKHAAVQDVAVIGIPDEEFGEQVKAFVELKPGTRAAPDEIVAHAALHLASYKRPKSVDIVPELPRNTMGKILKRELREPFWQGRERKV